MEGAQTQNKPQSKVWIGVALLLLFSVFSGSADVLLGNRLQKLDPLFLLLVTVIPASLFFALLNVRRLALLPGMVRQSVREVLTISSMSVAMWLGYAYALKYLEPAVLTSFALGLGPIFTLILQRLFWPQLQSTSSKNRDLFFSLVLFILMMALVYFSYQGKSAIGQISTTQLIFGLGAAAVSGFGVVVFTIFSKKLNVKGWQPLDVMVVRYPILVAVNGIMFLIKVASQTPGTSIVPPMNWELLQTIVIVCAIAHILPPYCFQRGVVYLQPFLVAILLVVKPLLTLVAQMFDARLHSSMQTVTLVALIVATLMSMTIIKGRS